MQKITMWGRLTSIISNVVGWKEKDDFSDEEDLGAVETDQLMDQLINSVYSENERQEESAPNPVPSNVLLTRVCNGKITSLFHSDGLIDGQYFFDRKNAPSEGLDVGKTVTYQALRISEENAWKVTRIIHVHEEQWADQWAGEEVKESDPIIETVEEQDMGQMGAANTRTIVGKVVGVDNRDFIVRDTLQRIDSRAAECRETTFCLNNVSAEFVPNQGDIISMHCIVEISEETVDGSGQVIEVLSIKPARARMAEGEVTSWNGRTGIVNNETFFKRDVCEPGYVPKKRDEVKMEIIECEKVFENMKLMWRAISVQPLRLAEEHEENVRKPQRIFHRIHPDLVKDKGSLIVMENTNFGALPTDGNYKIEIVVTNVGESRKLISKYFIETEPSNLTLVSPKIGGIYIEPKDSVTFSFAYNKNCCSYFSEVFIIESGDVRIGRLIQWEVVNRSLSRPDPATNVIDENCYRKSRQEMAKNELNLHETEREFVPPPRGRKQVGFQKVNIPYYRVPDEFVKIMTSGCDDPTVRSDSSKTLKEYYPELGQPLSPLNHKKKLHSLLYIAEMDGRIDMGRYSMKRASFVRRGEFLGLEMDGLSEGRLSLLAGDSVYAVATWGGTSGGKLKGSIKKVLSKEIWIQFDTGFTSVYNSEDYDVTFRPGRGAYKKCHHAVEMCEQNQAYRWLFPRGVSTKPPQVVFEEEYDIYLKGIELELNSEGQESSPQNGLSNGAGGKTLKWIDPRLNHRQKEAVKNILRGEARPLPYIIFGPPGTGKTVTLVETILQIYTLMKDSRIIIATPSNSAANLVCERLIASNLLQPGDMVRLVAHHLVFEGKIPPNLLSYSATVDSSDVADNTRQGSDKVQDLNNELILRHRVIVGTCVALGQMMSLGVPRGHFTHIIVDEAGQCSEPEILIPLGFLAHESGQVVLAGDPLQLGPVIPSRIAAEFGLSRSLLSRLISRFPYQRDSFGFPDSGGYDPRLVTRLSVNYRSLPDILELPSSLFYDSDLEPWVQEEGSYESKLMLRATRALNFPSSAVVFWGIKGDNLRDPDNPSFWNAHEAWLVVGYVQQLLGAGIMRDEIGIITPYQKQVLNIKKLLDKMDSVNSVDASESGKLKVGSVEEFQGQERRVIIISTVRSVGSNHIDRIGRHSVRQLLGFVNSPERLNVAISRAQALLIICGDPEVLCIDHYWRSVVKYCVEKKSYLGVGIPKHLLE